MSEAPDHFRVPQSDGERVLRAIAAELKTMSREEFRRTAVEAGILTPDGKLTEHYRPLAGDADPPEQ